MDNPGSCSVRHQTPGAFFIDHPDLPQHVREGVGIWIKVLDGWRQNWRASNLATVTNLRRSGCLNWGQLFIVFCFSWCTSGQAYKGNCRNMLLVNENMYDQSRYENMINSWIEIAVNVVVKDTTCVLRWVGEGFKFTNLNVHLLRMMVMID